MRDAVRVQPVRSRWWRPCRSRRSRRGRHRTRRSVHHLGHHRGDHRGHEHERGGDGAQVVTVCRRRSQAGDGDGELAPGGEGGAARSRPRRPMPTGAQATDAVATAAKPGSQLVAGVLKTERQQQDQYPDLGGEGDEVGATRLPVDEVNSWRTPTPGNDTSTISRMLVSWESARPDSQRRASIRTVTRAGAALRCVPCPCPTAPRRRHRHESNVPRSFIVGQE